MPVLSFDIEHRYDDHQTGGIPVSVELAAGGSTRLLAFVDTGASYCLFQAEYAELLGLVLENGIQREFSTPNGAPVVGYGHEVRLTALGQSVDSVVYFTSDPGFRRNVLGRQGWLHHFRFGLILYDSLLYLGRYDVGS